MTYELRRANTGHIWHIVKTGQKASRPEALCGYAPGGKTHMGRRRARWVNREPYDDQDTVDHDFICPKCKAKYDDLPKDAAS